MNKIDAIKMRLQFFLVTIFFSGIASASQDSLVLVRDVKKFLENFNVSVLVTESREDFLKRVQEDHCFTDVSYTISLPLVCTKGKKLEIASSKEKKYRLGLFTENTYAIKKCGFWGGDEDGFYVGPGTIIVGKGLARFIEKGNYQWHIQIPKDSSDLAFENTPIQPLLKYILSQKTKKVEIPINSSASVCFTTEASEIVGRLQYT